MNATDQPPVEPGPNTKPICPLCASNLVVRDAWAEWDMITGDWVLKTTFDHFACDACGEEISEPNWAALDKTAIIRMQNDRFRMGDDVIPGRRLLTSGIQEMVMSSGKKVEDVVRLVAQFDAFDKDNDPHHEHDFGQFEFEGRRCFWKLDYYATDLDGGSEDPSDLTQTHRVLTIMLAGEY